MLDQWRAIEAKPATRPVMLGLGVVLMAVAPLVGVIPGPGGVFVFAGGLSLVLRYSHRAKRRYVRFKRRWPKHGGWADWGLRRQSAKRRADRAAAALDPD